ncbi:MULTISPECIES: ATP-binding cassette domain-containing protein [Flavobacteriaceae]|uniref:ATP-binding cassette domain-containing protein n=2 Tax=Flavobacteriaceae TaxID=49546 RepID=A0A4Y8AQX6_9FLAO|nr:MULTISPECIES: ATP-binding cassette domain-containing protein [Flavobacteriaceae]TEW73149.1 ATP-binding cassette domain-containing protein [Gramella jeungdoensis]GGK46645.1 ABC transporter ATP-binding protein [Lutibacter litoralis]
MGILEIDSIEMSFNNKSILNGIYLKAETGNITGILGSNGCGKSTLLRIIFGELQPSIKSLRINNKRFSKPFLKSNDIKYLPQFHFMPKSMTVQKAFQYFKVAIDSFNIIFPELSILKDQKFKTLSGGEKRIIETYLILKSPSKFVLLDEPFSHIAPIYIKRIKDLIYEEKQWKAIVLTDHLYKHIVGISDNLYILKDGWSKEIKSLNQLEFYKYANI